MIEVHDVRKAFRSGERTVHALQGVSFGIDRGRCAFIVGPSGSGKSTLLYLLGALDRADSGRIVVEGLDLTTMSEAEANAYRRDRIGFIFQSFNLIGNLTAVENVLVAFMPRGVSPELRRKAAQLLTDVGLGDQLSGGEQQRVAIARALIKGPKLLLADEPTGNLDPHTANHVFNALDQLVRASGLATVVATHNMELAARMDRRVTLRDGLIVEMD